MSSKYTKKASTLVSASSSSSMPESTINILTVPYVSNKTTTTTIVSFEIKNVWVVPFTSASIYLVFTDDAGSTYPRTMVLTGDDYVSWSSDDNYLSTYCNEIIHTIFNS